MSSRVRRGYASTRSHSVAPSLNLRRSSSTGMRVPRITGLPSITRALISTRSVVVISPLQRLAKALRILSYRPTTVLSRRNCVRVSPQPAGVRRQGKLELLVRIVGLSQNADGALEAWAGRLSGTAANDGVLHVNSRTGLPAVQNDPIEQRFMRRVVLAASDERGKGVITG